MPSSLLLESPSWIECTVIFLYFPLRVMPASDSFCERSSKLFLRCNCELFFFWRLSSILWLSNKFFLLTALFLMLFSWSLTLLIEADSRLNSSSSSARLFYSNIGPCVLSPPCLGAREYYFSIIVKFLKGVPKSSIYTELFFPNAFSLVFCSNAYGSYFGSALLI